MPDTNPAEPAAERGPLPSDLAPYLDTLREVERHLYAHRYAKKTLDVLGPTIDPAAVTADRGEALAVLEEEDHELVCSPSSRAPSTTSPSTTPSSTRPPARRSGSCAARRRR